MKKYIIILTIVLLVVIFVIMLYPKNLSVNSVIIPQEVTDAFKDEIRSSVFSELCSKYSVTDTKDFWQKRFPEGTGEEILAERAREKAIEYTIKLQLCTKDVNYTDILKDFEKENLRLKKAKENGEVIYGNTQYTLMSYLNYILSENERSYKAQYSFTNEQLLDIYNKNKEYYKKDDIVTVKRMSFPFYVNGQFDESLYYSQKEKAEAFITKPDYSLMKDYTFTFEDSKAYPDTYQYAMDMRKGDLSDLICDEASFEVIYCVDRKSTGYMDFETVKQEIIRIAEDERFNAEANNALLNAKISSHYEACS